MVIVLSLLLGGSIMAGGLYWAVQKDEEIKKFSIAAVGILAAQWVLFLTGFYAALPNTAAEKIFMPAWVVSAAVGFLSAVRERRDNQRLSRLLLVFAILNGFFAWAAYGLGSM